MAVEENRLLTVSQFAEKCKGAWPSESALRAIILDASRGNNLFQSAFKRVGKRVLVDPKAFWRVVNSIQE